MREGERIQGIKQSYRVQQRIGQPGLFGEAFLADRDGQLVVIKALRGNPGSEEYHNTHARLWQEAETLTRINKLQRSSRHQQHYAIELLDTSPPDATAPFLVLERATGRNVFHDIVEPISDWQRFPPAEEEMLQIARHLLRALLIVHEAGISYDDLKLDNLFWDPDRPHPLRIIDWNVVSPIAERGESGDWARFGARLLEMLSGYRIALDREGTIIAGQPQLAPTWAQLSFGLQRIITRALDLDQSRRYQDGTHLLADLEREIESFGLHEDALISRTRQALGQRQYHEARAWFDRARIKSAGNEALNETLHELFDLVERGRGRARQDWIESGRRLLQRNEFFDASDRFGTAYRESGSADADARRLLWLAEIGRRSPEAYAATEPILLQVIAAVDLQTAVLDVEQAHVLADTLSSLAAQYTDHKHVGWFAAEMRIAAALAAYQQAAAANQALLLQADDQTQVSAAIERMQQSLQVAAAALEQLPLNDAPDLRRQRSELQALQLQLEDQRGRIKTIAQHRETLRTSYETAKGAFARFDEATLARAASSSAAALQALRALLGAPTRNDISYLSKISTLHEAHGLLVQINALSQALTDPHLSIRIQARAEYPGLQADLAERDPAVQELVSTQLDALRAAEAEVAQAMQSYQEWRRASEQHDTQTTWRLLERLMKLQVHVGADNEDLQAIFNQLPTTRVRPLDAMGLRNRLKREVPPKIEQALAALDIQMLQAVSETLRQAEQEALNDIVILRDIRSFETQLKRHQHTLEQLAPRRTSLLAWQHAEVSTLETACERVVAGYEMQQLLAEATPAWVALDRWQQVLAEMLERTIDRIRQHMLTPEGAENPTAARTELRSLRDHRAWRVLSGDLLVRVQTALQDAEQTLEQATEQAAQYRLVLDKLRSAQSLREKGFPDAAQAMLVEVEVDHAPVQFREWLRQHIAAEQRQIDRQRELSSASGSQHSPAPAQHQVAPEFATALDEAQDAWEAERWSDAIQKLTPLIAAGDRHALELRSIWFAHMQQDFVAIEQLSGLTIQFGRLEQAHRWVAVLQHMATHPDTPDQAFALLRQYHQAWKQLLTRSLSGWEKSPGADPEVLKTLERLLFELTPAEETMSDTPMLAQAYCAYALLTGYKALEQWDIAAAHEALKQARATAQREPNAQLWVEGFAEALRHAESICARELADARAAYDRNELQQAESLLAQAQRWQPTPESLDFLRDTLKQRRSEVDAHVCAAQEAEQAMQLGVALNAWHLADSGDVSGTHLRAGISETYRAAQERLWREVDTVFQAWIEVLPHGADLSLWESIDAATMLGDIAMLRGHPFLNTLIDTLTAWMQVNQEVVRYSLPDWNAPKNQLLHAQQIFSALKEQQAKVQIQITALRSQPEAQQLTQSFTSLSFIQEELARFLQLYETPLSLLLQSNT